MRLFLLVPPIALLFAACDRSDRGESSVPPAAGPPLETSMTASNDPASDPAKRTDAEWRAKLSPEQYHVLREKGTERAGTGRYWKTTTAGEYLCAGCGALLFTSDSKFDSGCGWPSFDKATANIQETKDSSYGMDRTEITCSRCGGHIGHVFDDGPTRTGLRYCVNSASVALQQKGSAKGSEKGDETGKAPKSSDAKPAAPSK